jgi:hypothetical protein
MQHPRPRQVAPNVLPCSVQARFPAHKRVTPHDIAPHAHLPYPVTRPSAGADPPARQSPCSTAIPAGTDALPCGDRTSAPPCMSNPTPKPTPPVPQALIQQPSVSALPCSHPSAAHPPYPAGPCSARGTSTLPCGRRASALPCGCTVPWRTSRLPCTGAARLPTPAHPRHTNVLPCRHLPTYTPPALNRLTLHWASRSPRGPYPLHHRPRPRQVPMAPLSSLPLPPTPSDCVIEWRPTRTR